MSAVVFPGAEAVGPEPDHSSPSSVEIRNKHRYMYTPTFVFMPQTGKTLPVPFW